MTTTDARTVSMPGPDPSQMLIEEAAIGLGEGVSRMVSSVNITDHRRGSPLDHKS